MLGNKDFAKMLLESSTSGSNASGGGGDGKVRFDIKQVRQWDKEIENRFKNKANKVSTNSKQPADSNSSSNKLYIIIYYNLY